MNITLLFFYNSRQTPAKCCCRIYIYIYIHARYAGFRRFYTVSHCQCPSYISSTQDVAWLVLYPADSLPALSPSRGISCRTLLYVFLAIAVFLRKPVQGLRIYSQSFVYHLTGLFGTNIMGQLGWQCTMSVSLRSWVQIPHRPQFFFFQALFSLLLLTL